MDQSKEEIALEIERIKARLASDALELDQRTEKVQQTVIWAHKHARELAIGASILAASLALAKLLRKKG